MRCLFVPALLATLAVPAALAQTSQAMEKEAAFGRVIAQEHLRRSPPIDAPQLRDYLAKLAARIDPNVQTSIPLTIEIVDTSKSLRDYVLGFPGGYILFPLTMLANADSEQSVAQEVAHALAHIDISRRSFRPRAASPATVINDIPIVYMGGWIGAHDVDAIIPTALRKTLLDHEAEAKRLAAEWTGRAGLDSSTDESGAGFVAMREQAREITARLQAANSGGGAAPPSLRSRRP